MNGYLTRFLVKFLGFKGMSFIIGTVALFQGLISGSDWTMLAMSLSSLKVVEDIGWMMKNGRG